MIGRSARALVAKVAGAQAAAQAMPGIGHLVSPPPQQSSTVAPEPRQGAAHAGLSAPIENSNMATQVRRARMAIFRVLDGSGYRGSGRD
jgi:hypothetical protein